MTTATIEETEETGRTPSMFASLLVLGVMVALILLSVVFFGGEVAEGPLISHAIASSLSGVMGTIFVILAIGTVISTLYLTGTVASIIYYGVAIISAKFYYRWGKKDVTLPVASIDYCDGKSIYLNIDSVTVKALPAVPVKRS